MAWLHLTHFELEEANRRVCDGIRDLATKFNAPEKFSHTLTVDRWVEMMEEAGIDEAGRRRWHHAFERDTPEAHQELLASLGLDEQQIREIRRRSRADDDHQASPWSVDSAPLVEKPPGEPER